MVINMISVQSITVGFSPTFLIVYYIVSVLLCNVCLVSLRMAVGFSPTLYCWPNVTIGEPV